MRQLVSIAYMLAATAHADIWTLYDGDGTITDAAGKTQKVAEQSGVSCGSYNNMGHLRWRNLGGDWVDANGVEQGAIPQASLAVTAASTARQIEIDVSRLIGSEGFVLRRSGGAVVRLASRESSTPPTIEVTTPEGVIVMPITADASLQFSGVGMCDQGGNQRSANLNINPVVVMGFPAWPENAVSAKLKATLTYASGKSDIQVYALSVPRIFTSQANAVPVAENPRIIWSENFDAQMPKWWANLGYPLVPTSQWSQDGGFGTMPSQAGVWRANPSLPDQMVPAQGAPGVTVPRGTGYADSNGLMFVHHPSKLAFGVEMYNVSIKGLLGQEADEAWVRYMVKFGEDFHSFRSGDGGKLPGLKSSIKYCAGSGVKANGYCGWTLRNGFRVAADPENPAWPYVTVHTYAYHALQRDFTGQAWMGDSRGLVKRGEWACVEQYVKVNTPGVQDGINQLYINGELILDKRDVYLRAVKPEQGYGDWWEKKVYPMPAGAPTVTDHLGRTFFWKGGAVNSESLAIDGLYWVQHGGGGTPTGKVAQMWFDEFVISLDRVGCPK